MTGMNEAIMNQNDQMRLRILEQNDKIRQVNLVCWKHFLTFVAPWSRDNFEAVAFSNGGATVERATSFITYRFLRSIKNTVANFSLKSLQKTSINSHLFHLSRLALCLLDYREHGIWSRVFFKVFLKRTLKKVIQQVQEFVVYAFDDNTLQSEIYKQLPNCCWLIQRGISLSELIDNSGNFAD